MKLEAIAKKIRVNIIEEVFNAKSGHPGGSLSGVEILTYLYFKEMRIDPENPHKEDRDRFVLSKGHATPLLYATLAERGFFDTKELTGFRKIDSMLQGHPVIKVPGVDMSTGSLGQGFSTSIGMAISQKLDKKGFRTYVLLGDGELQEGICWEAFMAGAHYKLDNLTIFIDHNGLQIDGKNEDVMNVEPIADKIGAFGWNTISINGHDFGEIEEAVNTAKKLKGGPTAIIAKTVKGKGVSFMENQAGWHGKAPNEEERNKALEELGVF
ncbi:MAG: transketolase [Tissierellia bacterium]|nr:transketolase [Tissierellia bacterium]